MKPIATDGYDGQVTVADSAELILLTNGPWPLDVTMKPAGPTVEEPDARVDGSDLLNSGAIEGNGEIQLGIENREILSPELSAGSLLFQTEFGLTIESTDQIELGGLTHIADPRAVVCSFCHTKCRIGSRSGMKARFRASDKMCCARL